MKKLIHYFLPCLLLGLGCKKNTSDNPSNKNNQYITKDAQQGEGFTFYTDNQVFRKIADDRKSNTVSKPFEIKRVSTTDSILSIEVSFSSSCSSPYFSIIWNGEVLQTYPNMVNLFLAFIDSSCSGQQAQITKTLKINLSKFIGQTDPGSVFNVLNASSDENVEYISKSKN